MSEVGEYLEEDYSTWTACEMYGHNFVASESQPGMRYCTDCEETYFDEGQ